MQMNVAALQLERSKLPEAPLHEQHAPDKLARLIWVHAAEHAPELVSPPGLSP